MAKDTKTNAMRILDREKVKYSVNLYECDEFIDGVSIADMLSQKYEQSYKTLVLKFDDIISRSSFHITEIFAHNIPLLISF